MYFMHVNLHHMPHVSVSQRVHGAASTLHSLRGQLRHMPSYIKRRAACHHRVRIRSSVQAGMAENGEKDAQVGRISVRKSSRFGLRMTLVSGFSPASVLEGICAHTHDYVMHLFRELLWPRRAEYQHWDQKQVGI